MGQKLNQVIAVEKGIKRQVDEKITALYQLGQKGDPFTGFSKIYKPIKDDASENLPSEMKVVQANVRDIIRDVGRSMTDLFDVTFAKDSANSTAAADVVVNGEILINNAPVTYLLFLEKYMVHVHTIVKKLPVLSADETWDSDPNTSLFRSETTETIRTQKAKDFLVTVPATDKFPAQVVVFDTDKPVGTWSTTKLSGAMPANLKEQLLERIESLQRALKYAREEANGIEAPKREVGARIFNWLFSGALA